MRRVPRNLQQKNGLTGRKLCLVCKTPLPKRRSSYCSDEGWLRNTPSMIRRKVESRDRGVCAACGTQCQTSELYRNIRFDRAVVTDGGWREKWSKIPEWQADHILPVVEGGGLCGLEGYRTLCTDCHNKETAALAARRAMARKESGSLFVEAKP